MEKDKHLIVIGLSGGYDSTALMIKYLSEGYAVHAHHTHVKDSADGKIRWLGEKIAVDNIIPILKRRYNNLIGYSESELSYCNEKGWGGSDKIHHTYMLCLVCDGYLRCQEEDSPGFRFSRMEQPWLKIGPKIYNQIDIAEGQTASESFYNEHREISLVEGYFKHLQYSIPQPKLLFPFRYMTKKEVIKLIPPEIIKYCFTCRNPKEDLIPCGKCSACKRLEKAYE